MMNALSSWLGINSNYFAARFRSMTDTTGQPSEIVFACVCVLAILLLFTLVRVCVQRRNKENRPHIITMTISWLCFSYLLYLLAITEFYKLFSKYFESELALAILIAFGLVVTVVLALALECFVKMFIARLHLSEVDSNLYGGTSASLFVATISIIVGNFAHRTGSEGAIFACFIGTMALVSFILLLRDMKNIFSRISTYADYLSRAAGLIRETRKEALANERKKFVIRILCFSPKNGNMSARFTSGYREYCRELYNAANGPPNLKIQLVCLSCNIEDEKIAEFLETITEYERTCEFEPADVVKRDWSRTELTQLELSSDGCSMAKLYNGFGESFDRKACGQGLIDSYWMIKKIKSIPRHEVVFMPRHEIPSHHFILTQSRCIVVTPIHLPSSLRNRVSSLVSANMIEGRRADSVEMLGYETGEKHVIQQLEVSFDSYVSRNKKSCYFFVGNGDSASARLDLQVSHLARRCSKESAIGVLLVHGIASSPDDFFSGTFESLTRGVFDGGRGVSVFELRYRYRSDSAVKNCDFSMDSAVSDLVAALEFLLCRKYPEQPDSESQMHAEECPEFEHLIIVARGHGAYVSLKAASVFRNNYIKPGKTIDFIWWQPVCDVKASFRRRGHIDAFRSVYAGNRKGHAYVESSGAVFGKTFFSTLERLMDASEMLPCQSSIHILGTKNDKVAPWETLVQFVSKARKAARQMKLKGLELPDPICLDPDETQDHLSVAPSAIFVEVTTNKIRDFCFLWGSQGFGRRAF